ncbi:MAG TPA: 2-hydroxyacyl-CoA dehydratase [Acetomicrobium flavidum]|uniref:acyl-CoA dehydratase activase-related protein n=1 Tax=Acetomicrobium flavidum TaxID=49896 RepID=UPI002CE6BD3E|nr:2-hydroxyacyl-CoA dehydratase [Acetomicrobium flavidum]HOM31327.1 2-hydroxyacyl-CoA dehydratase [Acetomicrobium flavidum]HPP14171.1 2-hydroxyacyl-CoA dehydratase [Acetomicrobium flavidum]
MKRYFVGIDIGSSAIHSAILDESGGIAYVSPSLPHFGTPFERLAEVWKDLSENAAEGRIVSTAFTGIGAQYFGEVFPKLLFDYESVTIPKGVSLLCPDAVYIFHMGAKDSYFFKIGHLGQEVNMLEWSANSKCGGGSGILIEKQLRRLYLREDKQLFGLNEARKKDELMQNLYQLAESDLAEHGTAQGFNARCGVVIQSDLIHEQNEGAKRAYLVSRLYATVARNYNNDVVGARDLERNVLSVATGGVFSSDYLLERVRELLGISLIRPPHHRAVAAIGVALEAMEKGNSFVMDFSKLDEVTSFVRSKRPCAPPLNASLDKVHVYDGKIKDIDGDEVRKVTIGVDGGSTTTKAAVVDVASGELLDKIYISTHGDPEGALKEIFRYLSRKAKNYDVLGVCTTGSARKLYERILVSHTKKKNLEAEGYAVLDGAVDEITCHAVGIKFHDPEIDTIFEIGGQDMKFTTFKVKDGVATDEIQEARMNYSCQAGAGQTLENMAQLLDLDVKSSLQEAALKADVVPLIDSTCGVFMEMEENRLISEGFTKEQIAAAIVRATAASYFNKFVGGPQHVKNKCSCQGGPSLGVAFLAAMAQVTGKDIYAYPHRELFGAWGAGLFLRDQILQLQREGREVKSAFRGFEVVDMVFEKRDVMCADHFGKLSCGMRNCKLKIFSIGGEEVITGGFCPRGNSEGTGQSRKDYVEIYHRLLEKHFDGVLYEKLNEVESALPTIGIHRSGVTLGDLGVWSSALFKKLGFLPVLTPESNDEIAQVGINIAPTEFCIAMKLVIGHAALLFQDKRIKHLFNPCFIEEVRPIKPNRKFCIYTEAEGYLLQDILGIEPEREFLSVLYLKDDEKTAKALFDEFHRLGYDISLDDILKAITYANERLKAFKEELYRYGDEFLKELDKTGEVGYVGLGRDYVILDPQASSNSGSMFSKQRGMRYIPQSFLEEHFKDVPIDELSYNEYWYQNAHILQAAIFTAMHPRLFPIRQMNFACGPDSMKFYHESEIFRRAEKPFLHLVTDAQTNNAPFVTRAEAHERVVQRAKPKTNLTFSDFVLFPHDSEKEKLSLGSRIWLIPYMGEASRLGAAVLRHYGVSAMAMPTATMASKDAASRFITTETCFPLRGVVGDVMASIEELAKERGKEWIRDNIVIFLPTTSGPCRFGKYGEVLRIFLRQEGLDCVPIVSPSTDTSYIDIEAPEQFGGTLSKVNALLNVFRAIKMADMADDMIRRFRPYSSDKKAFDEMCAQRMDLLERLLVERGAPYSVLRDWTKETIRLFMKEAPEAESRSLPLVLYIGEIYTRQHDPYTEYVIKRLEEEGLEVVRGSITEWLEYINYLTIRDDPKLAYKFAQFYMEYADWRFRRIFGGLTKDREVLPKPNVIIEELQRSRRYHSDITGESPLVIGIFLKFMRGELPGNGQRVCGIFHVGPFTCMQEGVAMAKMDAMLKEESKRDPDLIVPMVHAFFGDSANTNLEAEIAAFREQCRLKAKINHSLGYDRKKATQGLRRNLAVEGESSR